MSGAMEPFIVGGDRALRRALIAVRRERVRQERLRLAGRFKYSLATPGGLTDAEKLACVVEELGELAQELLTQSDRRLARDTIGTPEALRTELLHVATCAVAWLDSLS